MSARPTSRPRRRAESARRPGPPRRSRPPGAPRPDTSRRRPLAATTDAREAALRVLHAVDTRRAFGDRLLDAAHGTGPADPRDRALLHALVKGALRWQGRLDWVLRGLVHVDYDKLNPWIRNALRLGAFQILFMDRIPDHAAVSESVRLAREYGHEGSAGLVNSVLRRLCERKAALAFPPGDDAESLAIWGSHPLWIVRRWLERMGPDETRALLEADNRTPALCLRVNRLKLSAVELLQRLASQGASGAPSALCPDVMRVEAGELSPMGFGPLQQGLCTAQDESEALVGVLVDPKPGQRVLDLCAAPGGKTTHLAERMNDQGEVWALERSPDRLAALRAAVARHGAQCVRVVGGDGLRHEFPAPFDRVLVDAPCSGLGVLARRADARWRKREDILETMPPVQLELLLAGARQLAPAGALVYSVCSFEPEETWQVVERFLEREPGFRLEDAALTLSPHVVDRGALLTLPHRHGCDGAFAARLVRR